MPLPPWRVVMWALVGIVLLLTPGVVGLPARGASPDVTVDFTASVRSINALTFGMDESAYGMGGLTLPTDPLEQQRISSLRLGHMRVDLELATPGDPNSAVLCGADGCVGRTGSPSGDDYVRAIKNVGAEPVAIIPIYRDSLSLSVTDAANMVKHFNITAATLNPVKRWIIYNEPDGAGMSASDYSTFFNQMHDAMKAIDPTIKVGGPATAWFNSNFLQTFLTASGSRLDFLDFHQYGQGGSVAKSADQLLAETISYESRINQLRSTVQSIVPARASQIEIQVGEWNLDWDGDPKAYTNFSTVWGASVLGRIARAGGLSLQYASKNGSIGALFETNDANYGVSRNDPLPIYHAHGMFTGQSLFRSFGKTLVEASTTLNNVEVYASADSKNIVVINKDLVAQYDATFGLTGVTTGSTEVWRKDENVPAFGPPAKLESVGIVNGTFSYVLAPLSVTTFVIK